MNDQTKGAGRVSNLTDEARARGASSTRLNALFNMEAVQALRGLMRWQKLESWDELPLRGKANLLEGDGVLTPQGFNGWSAVQVKRLEAKAAHILELIDAGELDLDEVYKLSNAPDEDIDELMMDFEYLRYLRETRQKQSE